jgi:triosephosphate isomerase
MLASNWKCNGTLNSVKDFINNHLNKLQYDPSKLEIMVAPVSIHIAGVKALSRNNI